MASLSRLVRIGALLALLVAPRGAADTPAKLDAASLIYPRNSPEARQQRHEDAFPVWSTLGVIALCAAGGFYFLKRGGLGARAGAIVHQRLAIEETRSLGNKQFLAVATYGDRRMLLAVCAGRIDLLCRLDDGAGVPEPKADPVGTRS